MTVFSFDVGKGSLGSCVRKGLDILELNSDLVDAVYPCITTNGRGLTTRVRMDRTRKFHKARLAWFKRQWEQAGLTALEANAREWSVEYQAGKYASGILLRCALLMGKTTHPDGLPFSDADLFKALYSAIRKRGYGDVAWANKTETPKDTEKAKKKETEQTQEAKDEAFNLQRSKAYGTEMEAHTIEGYNHPCFMEASRLGLWHKTQPEQLLERLQNTEKFQPIRGEALVAPRDLRRAEFEALFIAVQRLRPSLLEINPLLWMDGPTLRGFTSYYATAPASKAQGFYPTFRKLYGKFRGSNRSTADSPETPFDWQGVFNQKVPRFDNRIIAKCAVFSERNVCNADEPLAKEVKLLLALKNLTFEVNETVEQQRTIATKKLTTTEFQALWEAYVEANQKTFTLILLEKTLPKVVSTLWTYEKAYFKKRFKVFESQANPNDGGRSRFSRPALALLKALLLSGQSPQGFIEDCLGRGELPSWKPKEVWRNLTETTKTGITHAELEEAKQKLGETWESFAIGDTRNVDFEKTKALEAHADKYGERLNWIYKRIGSVNNPVVRHRLEMLIHKVHRLRKAHGVPEKVIIEFVREGLNAHEATERDKFMKAQEKKRQDWKKRLDEMGVKLTPFNITKLRLWEEQNELCPYSGETIGFEQLFSSGVEVDHIVPVSRGGTDALHNKVVCTFKTNQAKTNRTPFEYLTQTGGWQAFLARTESLKRQGLSKKKVDILTATTLEDSKALETYTGLAETSYIARMSQEIVAFYFGWGLQVAEENRRLFVTRGEETAAFRRKYELNELLFEGREAEWEALQADKTQDYDKKLRDNKKHHALDAYAISFAQEPRDYFERYPGEGKKHWRLKNIDESRLKGTIQAGLAHVLPTHIVRNKAEMDFKKTLYGIRETKDKKGYYIVNHGKWSDLEQKNIASIFDEHVKKEIENRLKKGESWSKIKEGFTHPLHKTKIKKILLIESKKPISKNAIELLSPTKKDPTVAHWKIGEFIGLRDKENPNNRPLALLKSQETKGYILYKDKNGKYKDHKIPVFSSIKVEKEKLCKQQLELYKNGMLFYSKCIVAVERELFLETRTSSIKLLANQPFLLRTITGTSAVIELSNGLRFDSQPKKDKDKNIIARNPSPPSLDLLVQHGLYLVKEGNR